MLPKSIAAACLAIMCGLLNGQDPQRRPFSAEVRSVVVYATAYDGSGRLITNLSKESFEVFDNGNRVEIALFSAESVQITAALMIDVSASMVGDFMVVRSAALQFVSRLRAGDRMRVGTFAGEVALSPYLTADPRILQRVIHEEVWPYTGPGTALWSGLRAGLRSLENEDGRRVLLALTDGVDSCPAVFYDRRASRPDELRVPTDSFSKQLCATRLDVEQQASRGEFMVYAVGMKGRLSSFLTDIVQATGGGYLELSRTDDLAAALDTVAEELHHQYLIGFAPGALDGKTHKLTVRSKMPNVVVRARRSYVASAGR